MGKKQDTPQQRPAINPEAREQQLIAKAVDLAEKQLSEGTASAQVLVHFLRLGTTKAEVEMEKLRLETALITAKTEQLQSSKNAEEMYTKALDAMRRYSGQGEPDDD